MPAQGTPPAGPVRTPGAFRLYGRGSLTVASAKRRRCCTMDRRIPIGLPFMAA